MNICKAQLKEVFSLEKVGEPSGNLLEIRPFRFSQMKGAEEIGKFQRELPRTGFCTSSDNEIPENKSFAYTIFIPKGRYRNDEAILLLHGLNERSWEKYLTWADYLAETTGKAVILFPLAFHMNRTPRTWYDPRAIIGWVQQRKQQIAGLSNSTFVNIALSSRLSNMPLRFYVSGRESFYNLWQLLSEVRKGMHPLFREGACVHIFAYSIGALLAQVLMLANPEHLLDDTRLFMFCGGSLFSYMNGSARDILDREAFDRVQQYFKYDFLDRNERNKTLPAVFTEDYIEKAFRAMIKPELLREYRESFFLENKDRIRAVSLKKDSVMPTAGIEAAFGKTAAATSLSELDFPFTYSHQQPFPETRVDTNLVNKAFYQVFRQAAAFL